MFEDGGESQPLSAGLAQGRCLRTFSANINLDGFGWVVVGGESASRLPAGGDRDVKEFGHISVIRVLAPEP